MDAIIQEWTIMAQTRVRAQEVSRSGYSLNVF